MSKLQRTLLCRVQQMGSCIYLRLRGPGQSFLRFFTANGTARRLAPPDRHFASWDAHSGSGVARYTQSRGLIRQTTICSTLDKLLIMLMVISFFPLLTSSSHTVPLNPLESILFFHVCQGTDDADLAKICVTLSTRDSAESRNNIHDSQH